MLAMPSWATEILEKLQAGDPVASIIVLAGLIAIFFISKLLLSTMKAVFIVMAAVIIIAVLLPEAGVVEKAKNATIDAADYVKDKATKDNFESVKDKATNLVN